MRLRKTLVTFVILQWILVILGLIAGIVEEQRLSGVLRECFVFIERQPFTPFQVSIIILVGALLIANIVASVAICFLKSWARPLYVSSFLLAGVVVILMFQPELATPASDWFGECGTICIGITIALLYWSPLADTFRREVPNKELNPTTEGAPPVEG